jgi:hypothetical protein
MYMCIFKKNSETTHTNSISLIINLIKFFGMSKITKSSPILQRNGVKFNYVTHIQFIVILT